MHLKSSGEHITAEAKVGFLNGGKRAKEQACAAAPSPQRPLERLRTKKQEDRSNTTCFLNQTSSFRVWGFNMLSFYTPRGFDNDLSLTLAMGSGACMGSLGLNFEQ
ncbi:hypothetical protein K2173_006434 [Erythroxylum novogranatense]|uniref:Uncharacterized protein n=1 Tax=Erythroxylum novogranatense TaxID=1862640 RepID=A0AAV8U6H3_9ROSI|nr:hypothetical protein K2173_006434 [Erythroxylum novogranatense]